MKFVLGMKEALGRADIHDDSGSVLVQFHVGLDKSVGGHTQFDRV